MPHLHMKQLQTQSDVHPSRFPPDLIDNSWSTLTKIIVIVMKYLQAISTSYTVKYDRIDVWL